MGSSFQNFKMKHVTILMLIVLAITLKLSSEAGIQKRQATLPACESSTCEDCRGNCDGCNKCPLCAIVQNACKNGNKKLRFQGADVCERCKYCSGGKEECKRQCLIGKKEETCSHCINNCPNSTRK